MESYLDFDLLFRRTDTGYRAQVVNSPAGQAVSAAGRAASSVGARLRDAAVVRRGI